MKEYSIKKLAIACILLDLPIYIIASIEGEKFKIQLSLTFLIFIAIGLIITIYTVEPDNKSTPSFGRFGLLGFALKIITIYILKLCKKNKETQK